MSRILAVWTAVLSLTAGAAHAQSLALEGAHSGGVSTESIAGAGTQLRLLGDWPSGWRVHLETSWGWRSKDESDAFGTAYPYGGDAVVMEGYGEYLPAGSRWFRSVRAGRYRTPFGMSAASDHAYIGFVRPPLIRYGEYYALSNTYLEHGASIVVGTPALTVEGSVSRPADVGDAIRRSGATATVRGQLAAGAFIVGASYIDTTPYLPRQFATGRSRFGGVDVRWMAGGVLLRGEWLGGQPFDGTRTTGGYADLIVHRPAMGPVTAFARAERLAYATESPFALYTHRYTAGARVRVWRTVAASVGVVHQAGQLTQRRRTAFDAGITAAWRRTF